MFNKHNTVYMKYELLMYIIIKMFYQQFKLLKRKGNNPGKYYSNFNKEEGNFACLPIARHLACVHIYLPIENRFTITSARPQTFQMQFTNHVA